MSMRKTIRRKTGMKRKMGEDEILTGRGSERVGVLGGFLKISLEEQEFLRE